MSGDRSVGEAGRRGRSPKTRSSRRIGQGDDGSAVAAAGVVKELESRSATRSRRARCADARVRRGQERRDSAAVRRKRSRRRRRRTGYRRVRRLRPQRRAQRSGPAQTPRPTAERSSGGTGAPPRRAPRHRACRRRSGFRQSAREPLGAPFCARVRRRSVESEGQRAQRSASSRKTCRRYVKPSSQRPRAARGGAAGWASTLPPLPQVDFSKFGPVETQPLSRIKKLSGAFLHRNWVAIPHVTQHDEADITELEAFRKAQADEAKKQGIRFTCSAS